MMTHSSHDIVIVGGGVIGLSIAYALAREGVGCTVLDRREPGREASWAGAGLLPPPSENPAAPLHPTVAFRAWSAELFPRWSDVLREETGIDNGYRRCGGVDVALGEDEEQALRATAGRWRAEGIVHERLAPGDYARVEPALDARARLVYFLPDRAQVRNPWHLRALKAALAMRGVRVEPFQGVSGFDVRGDRILSVRTIAGDIACDQVVLAAGAWSGKLLEGLGVSAPTPPVKGQIVLLRHDRILLRRVVEHGKHYLVPREDGRVLVGATEEDAGFDTRTTSQGVRDLIGEAIGLCPVLACAEVEACWAGLRPGSIDARPYLGEAPGYRNLLVATGHKRAGLQLSPATGELMADLVLNRRPRIDVSHFRIGREPDLSEAAIRS
jgi:glycine oxidase